MNTYKLYDDNGIIEQFTSTKEDPDFDNDQCDIETVCLLLSTIEDWAESQYGEDDAVYSDDDLDELCRDVRRLIGDVKAYMFDLTEEVLEVWGFYIERVKD